MHIVTDDELKSRLDNINELLQQGKGDVNDENKNTFQTVQLKGDLMEAAVKRAEEQRDNDETHKSLEKEKELIQLEKQKRKVEGHYHQNWEKSFKQVAESEVGNIVENALTQMHSDNQNGGDKK